MRRLPYLALLTCSLQGFAQELERTPGGSIGAPAEQREILELQDPALDGAVFEVIEHKLHDLLLPLERALQSGAMEGTLEETQTDALHLAESFVTTPLRPAKVQTIEVGEGRTLVRNLGRSPEPTLQGAESLKQVLKDLRAPFEEDVPLDRLATKVVYGGRGEGDEWTALIRIQLAQDRPLEAREQVAQWIVKLGWMQPEAQPGVPKARALMEGEIELRELRLSSFQELVRRPGGPLFVDATESVFAGMPAFEEQLQYGLDDWCQRVDARLGLSLLGHEGLALGDVNGDGRDDLYVLEPGGMPNRLFLARAAGGFEDVSSAAGVDFLDPSRSALFVDLDGDGDQDLAAVIAGDLLILSNERSQEEESARFRLRARLPAPSFFSLSAADIENDGDLDLYACAYALPYAEESTPLPYHDANNGSPNVLYRNEGGWRFSDATVALGLDEANRRFSFAAAWEDYDLDGDQDLYVANDFGRNVLYRNDLASDVRFVDVAAQARVEDISAGMGVDWADVDGDGTPDVHVSNMFSSAGGRIAFQPEFQEGAPDPTIAAFQRHARGNSLFRGSENGVFRDVSRTTGVSMGRWAWGALFLDFENDGAPDIYVPNGYVSGVENSGDL